MNSKLLLQLGAGAGAVTAIAGVVVLVIPLLQSDPPPFVGKASYQQVAQTIDTLQRNNAALAAHQSASDENLDLIQMSIFEHELEEARTDFAKFPSQTARNAVCEFTDRINRIRIRNKLPPIQSCQ